MRLTKVCFEVHCSNKYHVRSLKIEAVMVTIHSSIQKVRVLCGIKR